MPLTLDDLKQRDMTATALRKDSDMDYLETQFEFEELNISVCGKFASGMMLYGTATLEGDDDGFSVSHIRLGDKQDHVDLVKNNGGGWVGTSFEDELFRRIASIIENPKTHFGGRASDAWDDLREEALEAA